MAMWDESVLYSWKEGPSTELNVCSWISALLTSGECYEQPTCTTAPNIRHSCEKTAFFAMLQA